MLPKGWSLVRSHEELVRRVRHRALRARLWRLLRNPVRPALNRMGFPQPPGWQSDFIRFRKWPADVRRQLERLPRDFVTFYSLLPDSAYFLYEVVRQGEFQTIVECGCGISTVIIGLALGNRSDRFLSLEHEACWLQATRDALVRAGLSGRVELHHAPLKPVGFGGQVWQAHDDAALLSNEAGLLLVDAPPGGVGRMGVLPRLASHLQPGALVLLDDASRPAESACVSAWVREGLASLGGYLPVGTGIAILRAKGGLVHEGCSGRE